MGDVITSASSLADRSWFVLAGFPVLDGGIAYRMQLCFQFDAAGALRLKVSPRAGFVGGTPSPTQVPSATDEAVFWGGGTDASPIFTTLLPSSGAWMQARLSEIDDAFYVYTYAVGGSLPTALFYLETLPQLRSLGGDLVDKAPWVMYAATGVSCGLRTDLASEARGPWGWLSFGDVGSQLWARLPGSYRVMLDGSDVQQPTIPGAMITPPSPSYSVPTFTQETLRYGRRTGLAGVSGSGDVGNANTVGDKGEGCYLRWSGTRFTTPTLVSLACVSSGASQSNAVVGLGDLMFPWEIMTAPSL